MITDEQIDRIIEFVKNSRSIKYITFYGGEPLLAIDKMKKIISKLEQIEFQGEYSFTTNGELLTEEMIKYFAEKKIHMTISYDGVNHSLYRKSIIGNNVENQLIEKLKYIQSKYSEYYYAYIGFSVTLTPPYELKKNAMLFNENPLFNKNQLIVSFVDNNTTWSVVTDRSDKDKKIAEEEYNELMYEYCYKTNKLPFHKALFDADMRKILCRKEPHTEKIGMNGCCIPGNRRIFFSLAGEIYPCEKVSLDIAIGNWNNKSVVEYNPIELCKRYYEVAKDKCKNCWLSNMCDSCFVQLSINSDEVDNRYDIKCVEKTVHMKKMLTLFTSCLEVDENSLDFLLDDEMV